jgi:L-rhamnose isomerase
MAARHEYPSARARYADLGVDTEQALQTLAGVSLSVHCWQGDDVGGFEQAGAQLSGGGIQVTGAYPGRARTLAELRQDLERMYALVPGRHRLALHASYGDFGGRKVDRDGVGPEHFESWMAWSAAQRVRLDFNSTFFSHPLAAGGFTLSSKEERVRRFWVEHARRCRRISAAIGQRQGSACIHNLWIPDGAKDTTVDRAGYRRLLAASLDEVYEEAHEPSLMKDSLEGKLFGIGSEAFVVGSHEFYLGYALRHGKLITLDTGHYHPTESVADKVSALFLFFPEILFHLSRAVRWDSDHVTILSDDLRELCAELVRAGRLERAHLGLDFFDGTLNRIGAWAVGARAVLQALLLALLEPHAALKAYEEKGDFFARLALLEQLKSLPFGAVWEEHCRRQGAPGDGELIGQVQEYEERVTGRRG